MATSCALLQVRRETFAPPNITWKASTKHLCIRNTQFSWVLLNRCFTSSSADTKAHHHFAVFWWTTSPAVFSVYGSEYSGAFPHSADVWLWWSSDCGLFSLPFFTPPLPQWEYKSTLSRLATVGLFLLVFQLRMVHGVNMMTKIDDESEDPEGRCGRIRGICLSFTAAFHCPYCIYSDVASNIFLFQRQPSPRRAKLSAFIIPVSLRLVLSQFIYIRTWYYAAASLTSTELFWCNGLSFVWE